MNGLAYYNRDPRDFSEQYNTKLSKSEEVGFLKWAIENNRLNDAYDYDIRGAYKELKNGNMTADERGHLGDKYKKPNHPTFSNQSIYHNQNGFVGGKWIEDMNDNLSFIPASTNMYSKEELFDYFNKVEPNVLLQDNRIPFNNK